MKVILAALFVVALFATPAAAQARDPFDPVIQPGTTGDTTGDTAGEQPTITNGARAPGVPAPTTDTLGNTGADVEMWLVAAFAAFVVGGTALLLGRLHSKALI